MSSSNDARAGELDWPIQKIALLRAFSVFVLSRAITASALRDFSLRICPSANTTASVSSSGADGRIPDRVSTTTSLSPFDLLLQKLAFLRAFTFLVFFVFAINIGRVF